MAEPEVNRRLFARQVKEYAEAAGLRPAEQRIVDLHRDRIAAGRLLDLGIGAGRTTAELAPLAREYVGIDYVPELVTAARQAHPGVDIRHGDARDLSEFADRSIDVVLFSFNGIDCVGHDDRLRIIEEMSRVLTPGGLLILSSHNRGYERFDKMPWQTLRFGRRTLTRSLHALRHLPRHIRLSRQGETHDEWAIINDDAHDWGMLLYYVTIGEMRRQLEAAGFTEVTAYDVHGRQVEEAPKSVQIYYTAVRR